MGKGKWGENRDTNKQTHSESRQNDIHPNDTNRAGDNLQTWEVVE